MIYGLQATIFGRKARIGKKFLMRRNNYLIKLVIVTKVLLHLKTVSILETEKI